MSVRTSLDRELDALGVDPATEKALVEKLFPVGPAQIPVWFGSACLGRIGRACEGLAIAWALHEDVFGWGPSIWEFLSSRFAMFPAAWGPQLGSTWFVLALNFLTLYFLRRDLRRLWRVRGKEKRPLVWQLFLADLKAIPMMILVTGIFLYVLYTVVYGQRGPFDLVKVLTDLYTFLWGFTQERHSGLPMVRQPVTGMYVHPAMPWFIRAGAIGLFASLGLLFFRTLWSGLYLLFAPRPYRDEMDADEAAQA